MVDQNTTQPSSTLTPQSIEKEPPESGSRNSHDHNHDAILTDELPYVIGGVTIVCIIAALAVAVLLWRKGRPCRQSKRHIESIPRKYGVIRLRGLGRMELSDLDTNTEGEKWRAVPQSRRPAPVAPGSQHRGALHPQRETTAVDAAPDIITAHDSESVYETVDERPAPRPKPTHVLPGMSQSRSEEIPDKDSRVGSAGNVYDRLKRFNNRELTEAMANSHRTQGTFEEDTPPPLPPSKPQVIREPDGSVRITSSKHRSVKQIPSDPNTLAQAGSLGSALEKLSLQNRDSGGPLVCRLMVVGRVENGQPVLQEQPNDECNSLFLLEPGASPDPRNKPAFSPSLQIQGEEDVLRERRNDTGGTCKPEYHVLEPSCNQENLMRKKTAKLPYSQSSSSIPGLNAALHSRRRSSLQNYEAGCSRNAVRRCSENTLALSAFRDCNLTSLPTLPSTQHSFLSVPKVDYTRSYSSPQSSSNKSSDEGRLDAVSLQAWVQREMQALGFLDDSELQDPGMKTDTAKTEMLSQDKTSGDVCKPPENEYFILEPDPDASENESDDCSSHPTVGHPAVTPRLTFKPYSPNQSHADLSRKAGHGHKPSIAGLPPRFPKKAHRTPGHSRSRSETPLFRGSQVQRGEKREEEEQGPVIVSLKKFRSMHTERGPEPRAAGLPQAGPPQTGCHLEGGSSQAGVRKPAQFRSRIRSEPSYS